MQCDLEKKHMLRDNEPISEDWLVDMLLHYKCRTYNAQLTVPLKETGSRKYCEKHVATY